MKKVSNYFKTLIFAILGVRFFSGKDMGNMFEVGYDLGLAEGRLSQLIEDTAEHLRQKLEVNLNTDDNVPDYHQGYTDGFNAAIQQLDEASDKFISEQIDKLYSGSDDPEELDYHDEIPQSNDEYEREPHMVTSSSKGDI